jgi:3-deoxy-manno-octulosonate cytidylyltransferase (CMP-KDO synthetase)
MAALDRVVVATDSDEIAAACATEGVDAVLTDPAHPSGTDRVAEVARMDRYAGFEVLVNLQGDEPLVEPGHVSAVVDLVVDGGWMLGTCAVRLGDVEELRDPSRVKVARAEDGRALYFSRAGIPFKRDGDPTPEELGGGAFLRHLGLYSYRREALMRWVALPPSPLEVLEKLEQLRPLEAGMQMGVAIVDEAEGGVDTPADVERTERRLLELGESPRT